MCAKLKPRVLRYVQSSLFSINTKPKKQQHQIKLVSRYSQPIVSYTHTKRNFLMTRWWSSHDRSTDKNQRQSGKNCTPLVYTVQLAWQCYTVKRRRKKQHAILTADRNVWFKHCIVMNRNSRGFVLYLLKHYCACTCVIFGREIAYKTLYIR